MTDLPFNGLTRENYKARWAEALKSGDYEKRTGALHMPAGPHYSRDGYCCLGVLCAVAGLPGVLGGAGNYEYLGEASSLPMGLAEHLNISRDGDLVGSVRFASAAEDEDGEAYADDYSSLVGLNDESAAEFRDIADIILTKEIKPFAP